MMTSSNGNIFRVTGPLWGEFTGPGEFPSQRPVTRSFDVFFDLRLNKRLSKQSWGWWFETPAWSLWRHRNVLAPFVINAHCYVLLSFSMISSVLKWRLFLSLPCFMTINCIELEISKILAVLFRSEMWRPMSAQNLAMIQYEDDTSQGISIMDIGWFCSIQAYLHNRFSIYW